jgi:hypothetical protein
VLAACAGRPLEERVACYEPRVLDELRGVGVARALRLVERLAAHDAQVRRDGHVLAHVIGIAAYEGEASVGRLFAECTPAFQSGCYHGVVQAHFAALQHAGLSLDAARIQDACAAQRGDPAGRWLLFQCAHGIGHGLVLYHGYELTRALGGCDLLGDAWEREACYGGAFMETLVAATDPHHAHSAPPAAAAAHANSHAHHDHAQHDPAQHAQHAEHQGQAHAHGHAASVPERYRPMRDGDLLHPCTTVEWRYRHACISMQTSAILRAADDDVGAVAAVCAGAPDELRPACYASLGRDVSALSEQDHARGSAYCESVDTRFRAWCHVGLVRNLIDLRGEAADGLAYCRQLGDPRGKAYCYEAVGAHLWVLHAADAARDAGCTDAEPAYRDVCRYGAGLLRTPPQRLRDAG